MSDGVAGTVSSRAAAAGRPWGRRDVARPGRGAGALGWRQTGGSPAARSLLIRVCTATRRPGPRQGGSEPGVPSGRERPAPVRARAGRCPVRARAGRVAPRHVPPAAAPPPRT